MNEITSITFTIPQYIRKVLLSQKRNKKFYEAGKKKLPKKYQDIKRYGYRKVTLSTGKTKMRLYDLQTRLPVIANPRTVGTPRYAIINGQAIYNGQVSKWSRNTMVAAIKDSFRPYLKYHLLLSPIEGAVKITYDFHDNFPDISDNKDLDNHAYIYAKCFQDLLVEEKILENDNIHFVRSIEYNYHSIDNESERKLVITIEPL